MVVVGGNGKGKSNFAQAVGYDLNSDFSDERAIFGKTEWELFKFKAKRGMWMIFDEGIDWFFSRDSMTFGSKENVKDMAKIRSMGLGIMVCIPSLKLLDWYVKEERPHIIVRVNSPKFELWSFMDNDEQTEEEADVKLQTLIKYGFDSVSPDMEGTWSPVDGARWEAYEKKKRNHVVGSEKSIKIIKAKLESQAVTKECWTLRDIQEEKNVSDATARKYVKLLVPKSYWFYDFNGVIMVRQKGKAILDRKWKAKLLKLHKKHPKGRKGQKGR